MKTLQDYIDKLNSLNFKEMYNNDFFWTWDKTDEELEAVFTVADALRFMREHNISTKVFESGLGISIFRDNSTRTRFSFASACNLLGLEVQDLDRINHVDVCDANTGPIYLACRYTDALNALLEQWKKEHKAAYDFTEEDEITHRVWVIDGDEAISQIQDEMEKIPALYIADGHHRAASAVKVGLKRRQENPDYTGEEEFNYFLSVVFPYDQLTILAYNRVVRDLNGQSVEDVLEKIKENFDMTIVPGFPAKPVEKHCFGMYLDGFWYLLKAKPELYEGKDVVGQLDSQILQDVVLGPVLGIGDPRTDKRIKFVGGSHKLRELQGMADETRGVAFALYPTSMEDLMQIADESKLMPPKSTWFEPKLRSGIFVHKLRG